MINFLSSPHLILIILLIVIILSLITALLFKPEEFPKSRINVFISILASVTVILIGLSLAISSVTLHEVESIIRTYTTKEAIDKLWLYPNQMLAKSTAARPSFLQSFYYNNPYLQTACSNTPDPNPQSCVSVLEEQNIAITMIQSWEDYLTMRSLDFTGDAIWLHNFIQWAQSPYLKQYFNLLKYNFKISTIHLGEILFRYAEQIPKNAPSPEIYRQVVDKIMKDPEYIDVIQDVHQDEQSYTTVDRKDLIQSKKK